MAISVENRKKISQNTVIKQWNNTLNWKSHKHFSVWTLWHNHLATIRFPQEFF